ncbi:MAG TPA: hypothetical protein DIW27_09730 [Cytophagales bacterium]|nr:hypothetical protein [Cytophagales bacterium]
MKGILKSNFFIKLKSWEYWPFGILQAPIFIYWLWLSLKARSLFFFSASNPGILTGGMFGESKFSVLEKIPEENKPKSVLINYSTSAEQVLLKLKYEGFQLPVIFKPDLGERGWMVKKINTEEEARNYIAMAKWDFIIQEYVSLPLEFSVFYWRHPERESGHVTSVTRKEMLKVRGDGSSTLQQLILNKDRAKLQWNVLEKTFANQLNHKPDKGEEIELVSIGNHCLGTTFINQNHLITEKLSASFDHISKKVEGFYFGRFDLRTASLSDLENGKVKIMELNGCGAEPSHIYHPGASFWKAMKDLFVHWNTIYKISIANHAKGAPYLSWKEGVQIYKKFKALKAV